MLINADYYDKHELGSFGFRLLGFNVSIAKNCVIVGTENISIGNNVRIDSFCSLIASAPGFITLGSNIHIASYCLLSGGAGVIMENFSGLSHGVHIYSQSDDYSGNYLTNPMVPIEYTNRKTGVVHLEKHVIIGSGSVILPHVTLKEGVAVGALSLVTKNLDEWYIYSGCPAIKLKKRANNLLSLENKYLDIQQPSDVRL